MIMIIVKFSVQAHENSAYSHDSIIGASNNMRNWMENLPDHMKINSMSIPGSNYSASYSGHQDFSLTQSMSIEEQLLSGIRFLSLGFKIEDEFDLIAYRGNTSLNLLFEDILETITLFLDEFPNETVLLKINSENSYDYNFEEYVQDILSKSKYTNYIFDGTIIHNPSLGEARGKIIVYADYKLDNNSKLVIPYRVNTEIQENVIVKDNWALYEKWEKVKSTIRKFDRRKGETRFVNYLSGYSEWVFPYFVASGHVSPATNADRLLTGLTEPGFKDYYPDFPRVGHFLFFSSIAFEGINTLFMNYINERDITFTGIVLMDFPGPGIIETIVDLNYLSENLKKPEVNENEYEFRNEIFNEVKLDKSSSRSDITIDLDLDKRFPYKK